MQGRLQILYRTAALALLAFLFATNVYRAITQSITFDEACTFTDFITPRLRDTLNRYDANNHVLYTLLGKASIRLFGSSEAALRLPSVLGGLLYFVSAYRLSSLLFGYSGLFLLSVALCSLNPFTLDYLSAARGYGLALGLFTAALYWVARSIGADENARGRFLSRAAIALGLSVAANLVFVVPAMALCTAYVVSYCVGLIGAAAPRSFAARFWSAVDQLPGPAAIPAFIIVIIPLTRAERSSFYYGAHSLLESTRSLVENSLGSLTAWLLFARRLGFPGWVQFISEVLAPALVFIVAAAALIMILKRVRRADSSTSEQRSFLLAGSLIVTLAIVVAMNRGFGVLFPLSRTGIYLPVLLIFSSLAVVEFLRQRSRLERVAGVAVGVLWLLFVPLMALGWKTDSYSEWRYDAGTKRIAQVLSDWHRNHPGAKRLGIDWLFEPSLSYYRRQLRMDWIQPLDRKGPEGSFDIYVLLPENSQLLEKRGLKVLYRDPVSEAVIAAPASVNPV